MVLKLTISKQVVHGSEKQMYLVLNGGVFINAYGTRGEAKAFIKKTLAIKRGI